MPDFTIKIYKQLLEALKDAGYRFLTFEEYLGKVEDGSSKSEVRSRKSEVGSPKSEGGLSKADSPLFRSPVSGLRSPLVILRHDVDLLPQNSLAFARIQHEMGIRGSYYFRAVPESWDEDIIKEIHSLGHEVGYHYEDMDIAGKRETTETQRRGDHFQETKKNEKTKMEDFPASEGTGNVRFKNPSDSRTTTSVLRSPSSGLPDSDIDFAIHSFAKNLEKLRQLVPVSTICMHGSPRSRYDNRDLWKKYDYRDYGIIGEPYFDVDFDEMFYLTDTGRRWDGWKVSIRDKMPQQREWIRQGLVFRSTQKIIERLKNKEPDLEHQDLPASGGSGSVPAQEDHPASGPSGNVRTKFPHQLMMTFHPQRWTDKPLPWFKEWVMQNAKNSVKYMINLRREDQ